MLFSEPVFFAFFSVYFVLHLLVPATWRLYLIIVGSAFFYAWWRVDYIWLPFVLTWIAWAGALWTNQADSDGGRRFRLTVSLLVLFAPLVVIKYSHFIYADVLSHIPGLSGMLVPGAVPEIGLPLGISFVTFTLTAYIVDIYRGRYPIERRLDRVLGYVLFFPHLIAGPILRPNELLPQLAVLRRALDARILLGVCIFTIGLIKKVIFADTIAGVVDPVFAVDGDGTSLEYLLAIYGFSIQIYCDFSGYTDMAIGLALILGIRLPTNFLRPYSAASIIDFWRRWHITLSYWLRDYLYIPLGGNRFGEGRRLTNLMTTMILGGLWHGAAWTFVVWGFMHGLGLVIAHGFRSMTANLRIRIPTVLAVLITFHFVTLAWVFFRAPDMDTAFRVLAGPFVAPLPELGAFVSRYAFELTLGLIFFLTHPFDKHARMRFAVKHYPKWVLLPAIALGFLLVVTLSQGSSGKFIYFDF
ncbi:MAG: MBOAT family O-acyltransferase [Pseudomonadota bacterium]